MLPDYTWHPPKTLVEESNVSALMDKVGVKSYSELVKKSVEDVEWWWRLAVEELEVYWYKPYSKVLDLSGGVEWAKWFVGGEVNVAYNALDRHVKEGRGGKTAFIWRGEDGSRIAYTYNRLYDEASRFAGFLKSLNVRRGDVVALYIPMLPETIVSMFGALKIGAIVAPIFSGFAPTAVSERLKSSNPKVVVTVDGYYRRGRIVRLKEDADKALELAGANAKLVVAERLKVEVEWVEGRDVKFSEALKAASPVWDSLPVDSEHPALLLYTSGTTGKPKGAVISHIGALLQPSKEIYYNLDLKAEKDLFLWITDIGWMMGPWQIIGVQNFGGKHLIFEGVIDYPRPDRLWSMVEEEKITHVGFAATVVRMLKRYGDEWLKGRDLSTIRMFGNTGEPIDPESWMWLMKSVGGERAPIINLSGGTEIFGCFLLPSPVVPLKPSTLWGPGLGMDIDVFNDEGVPVRGEVGYLVCKKPAPSMTRGFWGEPERYIETYWSRFPGVWYHGDWAYIDEDGYWYLLGRADDVIKVAGKRVGPAEVESIVNSHPAVHESACIGVPHEVKGEVLACFVTLREGVSPSENLEHEISGLIVKELGKPFRPEKIYFVKDLPRTRSGKIMRRIIKAVVRGQSLGETSVLENPESIKYIREVIGRR